MAAALREAGCQEAWLGAESGSQRVLDAMNKGMQVARSTGACATEGRRHPRRVLHPAGLSRRAAGGHPRHSRAHRTARPDDIGVSVRIRCPAPHSTSCQSAAGGRDPLAGQRRPGHDVPGTYTSDSIGPCATCCTTRCGPSSLARPDAARCTRRAGIASWKPESLLNTTPAPAPMSQRRRSAGHESSISIDRTACRRSPWCRRLCIV